MDKPSRSGKRLESILRETLLEISQGKNDPFHAVVADVLEDITAHEWRAGKKTEIIKKESG